MVPVVDSVVGSVVDGPGVVSLDTTVAGSVAGSVTASVVGSGVGEAVVATAIVVCGSVAAPDV